LQNFYGIEKVEDFQEISRERKITDEARKLPVDLSRKGPYECKKSKRTLLDAINRTVATKELMKLKNRLQQDAEERLASAEMHIEKEIELELTKIKL
jgi:uncharacterized Fe-S cluster-containing MiaB family protein